ncbi:MAG TPA: SUMF1/EgtB/PvdO family nonheme iron enzyme [Polyangiaceae bacterium]
MLTFVACQGRSAPAPAASDTPSAGLGSAPITSAARPPINAPIAGELVDVPGGSFHAGSVPAEPGRLPELEPRTHAVELGPFRIDRLPYPNDPGKAFVTGVSREEAKRLCAARQARLCTELEWERACKGPNSDRFASGPDWDPSCASSASACASGFDVLGMGTTMREWVQSDVIPPDAKTPRRAVVRGAPGSDPPSAHRCARRAGVDAGLMAPDLGFRCCQGAPNAAIVQEPKLETTFEKTRLSAERLERLLAEDPATRRLAKGVVFFREPDAANTVIARGPGDTKGFSFTVAPLLYRPIAGTEYLVLAARSGEKTSFVVAYYVLGGDAYKLAASFILEDEPGPVAFAYDNYIRPRFHFSTCWGCPESAGTSSETGKILFREPDEVVIVQP